MKTTIHILYPAINTAARKLAAFAALTLILAIGPSQAGPGGGGGGGGGGTGGGTIYFIGPGDAAQGGGSQWMRAMNSDGSNNRQLGFGLYGNPSLAQHGGGHRWFLYHQDIPGVYNHDGTQRFDLFAMRDDFDGNTNNNGTTRVQLTNDIDLQMQAWSPNWVLGDQKISFKARRWFNSVPIEGGIYTASVVFDANGNITGLSAQPITPAIPFTLVETTPGDLWPDFADYSWAPTGDKVVYTAIGNHDLSVADLLGSPHQRIFTGYALAPQWSPDGTKIAFTSSGSSISTIKPNGTQGRVIISPIGNWTAFRPYWSPGSNFIAFTGQTQAGSYPNFTFNMDVNRATATGGSVTDLTNRDYPFNEYIHSFGGGGWR